MFARRIAAFLILVGLVAAAWALGAATPPKHAAAPISHAAYPDTFAAGAGREIAERACMFCHSPMLVTQQHKDSTAWEKTLGTMEKWGLPLSPAEHDSLRTYLLATQGPRAAAKP
jgi:cytochrome c5